MMIQWCRMMCRDDGEVEGPDPQPERWLSTEQCDTQSTHTETNTALW